MTEPSKWVSMKLVVAPLVALEEHEAGAALRDAVDEVERRMSRCEHSQDPWADAIGNTRDVFELFERELNARGFRIVRSR